VISSLILASLSYACKSATENSESSERKLPQGEGKAAFYAISERLESSRLKSGMVATLDQHFPEIQEKINEAAVEISTFNGMSKWEKIDMAVDLYGRMLTYFVIIELPLMAAVYEVDHRQITPAVMTKVNEMKSAFKTVLVGAANGKMRFLVDYESIPGFKRFSKLFRLDLPRQSDNGSLNLATDPSGNPPLTVEDLLKQPSPKPLTPEISLDVNAEARSFRESFNKIVPNSLIISSMLIGTAVAIIVTVATFNPAIGGGVGVATGFGILAFVGGSYGIMKTIESYKTEIHAPAPDKK
jgi:hypothetical protein